LVAIPGKKGQPHNDGKMRRVQPAYKYAVEGYKSDWLQQYLDGWGALSRSATVALDGAFEQR
jgi:hypothetical protein